MMRCLRVQQVNEELPSGVRKALKFIVRQLWLHDGVRQA